MGLDTVYMYTYSLVRNLRHPVSLFMALFTRFLLTTFKEKLNVTLDIKDTLTLIDGVHVELVDIDMVVIGLLLVGVHGAPTIVTLLCLSKGSHQQILRCALWQNSKSILVLVAATICVMKNIAMFFFVREMWISHLCSVVQFLHLFPALATLLQPISNGVLCLTPELKSNYHTKDDYKQAKHQLNASNYLVIAYDSFNIAVVLFSKVPQFFCYLFLVLIVVGLVCEATLAYNMLYSGLQDFYEEAVQETGDPGIYITDSSQTSIGESREESVERLPKLFSGPIATETSWGHIELEPHSP